MKHLASLIAFIALCSASTAQDLQENKPVASLEILAATIGDSLQELTNEQTALIPKRMIGKRKVTRGWTLDRKFIEETATTEFPGFKGESRAMFTFDEYENVFRWWVFDTYGVASEYVGTWIPDERSIKWEMAKERTDGYTHSVLERINADGTLEWEAKGRQRDGTLAVHQTGKSIPPAKQKAGEP